MAVDLSAYPDLVVIYLGMRVEEPRGYETLQRLGPEIGGRRGAAGRAPAAREHLVLGGAAARRHAAVLA
jgi:hypothetical protein